MTKEEIIEGLKLLEDNMVYFDELLNDRGKWIDVHELLFETIEVLEQEPCEDCRNCNKWSECECGEKGHKNGTSIGYYIGECKDYEPCEDNQREFIELVVEYPNPDLCTYPEYRGKPYFSIKYRENGKYIVGFGSYKIEMISQWIKEYFMPSIQPKTDVLDKIRAEINSPNRGTCDYFIVDRIEEIIDKYTAEKEK